MNPTHLTLALAGVICIGLGLLYVIHAGEAHPVTGVQSNEVATADESLPARLTIPKISLDAAIEYVGLAPNGSMGAPTEPADVAWFKDGVRPGAVGAAVIDGHFGWKNNLPAAFDDLHKLQAGDRLYIKDGQGDVTEFVVRELRTYQDSDDASGVFSSSDGKAHLNLITCEGIWNATAKSYSDRLVVFTDKVPSAGIEPTSTP